MCALCSPPSCPFAAALDHGSSSRMRISKYAHHSCSSSESGSPCCTLNVSASHKHCWIEAFAAAPCTSPQLRWNGLNLPWGYHTSKQVCCISLWHLIGWASIGQQPPQHLCACTLCSLSTTPQAHPMDYCYLAAPLSAKPSQVFAAPLHRHMSLVPHVHLHPLQHLAIAARGSINSIHLFLSSTTVSSQPLGQI